MNNTDIFTRRWLDRSRVLQCVHPNLSMVILTCCFLLGLAASPLPAAPPTISSITPQAVCPGTTVKLTLHGEHLKNATQLWTSFASKCELSTAAEDGKSLECHLTLPRENQVGVGAVRLLTGEGISTVKLIMVDDLPSIAKQENNHQTESAQPVSAPTAIDASCTALKSDFYQIEAHAGEPLVAEVVAQRLGSACDPILRLLDPQGGELVASDDEPGTGGDSRLSYHFEQDGKYTLEVRDVNHQGGGGHFYRLRIGNFPLATVAFPMGAPSGKVATFHFEGDYVEGLDPIHILMPPKVGGSVPLSVAFPDGQGSGFVTVLASSATETVEVEPNNDLASATVTQLPGVINGRCQSASDQDYYKFTVSAGQHWSFVSHTRALGSPADLFLQLLDEKGNLISSVDDSGSSDGILRHNFGADGTFYLRVEDLLQGGSNHHAYRIVVATHRTGFQLSSHIDTANVPHAGTFVTKVTSQRIGFGGPIELSVDGLGEGLQLEGNVIPKDKNETNLRVTLPENISIGQFLTARIVGKPQGEEEAAKVLADTQPVLIASFPNAPLARASLDGPIAVAVGPVFPDFFNISLDPEIVYFAESVGKSTFKVLVNRINGEFKEAVSIAVEGFPEGVKTEVQQVKDNNSEYIVTQTGPEALTADDVKIRILATGTFQEQRRQVVLADVPFQVVKPLVVELKPHGAIKKGETQKVTIRVRRFGEEKHPVTIRWKEAPNGISAPLLITAAPDQDQLDIELSANDNLNSESEANFVVSATTKVKDQDISVESTLTLKVEPTPAAEPAKEEPAS